MKKKLFSLAVAVMLFSAIGMAQGPKGGPGKGGQKQQPGIEQMIRELDLDKSQEVKFRDAMRELEPNDRGMGGPQAKMGKPEDMKDKRKEVDKKVKKILNKKQYKKYQNMMP